MTAMLVANQFTNEAFHADLKWCRERYAARTLTNRQVQAMVDKWGARGGAFYGFFR